MSDDVNEGFVFSPAPPGVAGMIDGEQVGNTVALMLQAEQPTVFATLFPERLAWRLGRFDERGLADVAAVDSATGEVVAGWGVHWTAVLPAARLLEAFEDDGEG